MRIDATLKRYISEDKIKINDLNIDLDKKRVFLENQEVEFTKIESEIFFMFIENMNKVVSREDIVNQTSLKKDTKNRTIDMHVSNIRFKINDDFKETKYIKSIWGIGYKFTNDN
ncbi:MAG: winged helix-turn-helix domain-containing protein [Aliarcobacter sp.]|nr:winged helix-turn-helix domain-containing protein [Aliarcobacter sp.]